MSRVFILCFAQAQTGGPEALHSLGYKLRAMGVDAFMVYYGGQTGVNPVHPAYAPLSVPWRPTAEDEEGDIIVLPELIPDIAERFQRARPVIWWLSVDNYLAGHTELNGGIDPCRLATQPRIIHLAQSEYARRFLLERLNIPLAQTYTLRDYLHRRFFFNPYYSMRADRRLPIVLFNPRKGWEFTRKLFTQEQALQQNAEKNILTWLPLVDYSPDQCAQLLRVAMAYIDFGEHPGMDRIPREAAASGCLVITGRKGSAAFAEDLPLPPAYQFEDTEENMPAIIALLYDIAARYDERAADLAPYRDWINGQEARFERDAALIFSRLLEKPLTEIIAEDIEEGRFTQITELLAAISEVVSYARTQCATGDLRTGLDMMTQAREGMNAALLAGERLRTAMLIRKQE
jgi:hypothetical protein